MESERKTSGHTPGPWEVREKGVQFDRSDAGTFVGKVGSGLIARTFTNKSNASPIECLEMARADANLIAAAPELLKVLMAARSALRSYQYGNGSPDLAESIADTCDSTIAKAQGNA